MEHMKQREHMQKKTARNTSSGKGFVATLDSRNSSTAAEETAADFETALGYRFLKKQINKTFQME